MPERNARGPGFTYAISTMGCKANLSDSHAMESQLRVLGGVPAGADEADLFLLNTCTVTDSADREAGQILRRSRAGFTVATGCFAEVDPERLRAAAGESPLRVLRNSAKGELGAVVKEWLRGDTGAGSAVVSGDRAAWHGSLLPARPAAEAAGPSAAPRTRAFLKVQDGCNAFCGYCVIPLARGRSRSVPAEQVVSEARALTEAGLKEVVLTAIHAADYESGGLDFTSLAERVLSETSVPRLRLTSLDPAEIPDRLLDLMAREPRLCPHLHVSVQSANDRVLSAMKRGYGAAEVEERLQAIARRLPHAYVGMDLIAGYPGETDEEFADGLRRLERLPWTRAHVFPFSVRRSTAAARLVAMGQGVPEDKIRERARRLRALSDGKLREALESRNGRVLEVLTEGKQAQLGSRTVTTGHSRSFHKVMVPGRHPANELKRVRIVGSVDDCLKGEFV